MSFNPNNVDKLKKRLSPGIWIDKNGQGHLNIDEMLEHIGLENTPENHRLVRQMADELWPKLGQKNKVIHRTGIVPPPKVPGEE